MCALNAKKSDSNMKTTAVSCQFLEKYVKPYLYNCEIGRFLLLHHCPRAEQYLGKLPTTESGILCFYPTGQKEGNVFQVYIMFFCGLSHRLLIIIIWRVLLGMCLKRLQQREQWRLRLILKYLKSKFSNGWNCFSTRVHLSHVPKWCNLFWITYLRRIELLLLALVSFGTCFGRTRLTQCLYQPPSESHNDKDCVCGCWVYLYHCR